MENTVSLSDKISFLQLARSENVGPVIMRELLSEYGTAERALAALPNVEKIGNRKNNIGIFSREDAEKEWHEVCDMGGKIINITEEEYPPLLREIYDSPMILTVLGDYTLLKKKCFAVVGSRNATTNGCNFAGKIVSGLSEAGYVTVSGMASGIDGAAHKAALLGSSSTVAVLGTGAAVPYPAENRELYRQIVAKGAVVSEYPLHEEPKKQNFPRRNRIISGLSRGVLVVEASERSGSLITAKLALEQGREVFAVPGFPMDPRAAGPNRLIKQGAVLVRNADDILSEFETLFVNRDLSCSKLENIKEKSENTDVFSLDDKILSMLSSASVTIDDLASVCNISFAEIGSLLGRLELEGKIARAPGNRVYRIF